jgi:uncharacterized protein
MPKRDTAPIGAPCWIQLTTSDVARSREFYSRLLGWVAEEPVEEFGGYFTFTLDGVPVAGGMAAQPGDPAPDVWSVYLATDDAAKTVETAASHGGQVVVPPMAVGDLGTMAVVVDPSGAAVGAWQPDTFQGTGVLGDPGAPGWFELHARGYAEAVAFYRDVFRWEPRTMSDTDDFRYTTLGEGDGMMAGIMDAAGHLPAGVPSHWVVYFSVDDTDVAVARAVELGASVVEPAEDTPYGRLAALADPNGAPFRLGDSSTS